MSTLKQNIRDHLADPAVVALIAENILEPASGPLAPIAPPTYGRAEGDNGKDPNFATTENAFVPAPTKDGWHLGLQNDKDGVPRRARRVVVDSVGSQSSRAGEAVWRHRARLGVPTLPALVVTGLKAEHAAGLLDKEALPAGTSVTKEALVPQVAAALDLAVSTWQLAHRHADAWVRFATDPGTGNQVWAGGPVKDLITTACAERADTLYQHLPNACVYGFWLSSGVTQRHRLPRAYSSEVVGFGVEPVAAAATKLDPVGGTSSTSRARIAAGALDVAGPETTPAELKNYKKVADLGFGQVPTHPAARGFVCELILQQSSVALPVLRSLRFTGDHDRSKALAAQTVLTLLALAGRALANEDGFLRSGCNLVSVSERWGWRRRSTVGAPTVEALPVADLDEVAAALGEAVADAEAAGLPFGEPIELRISEAQARLITQRVVAEATKSGEKDGGS